MRVLFICKQNNSYGHSYSSSRKHSGLFNSTKFIADGLRERGINTKIVTVIDNNCIDREVAEFRPDKVIIEAIFVVPSKFHILKKLHPRVKWYIHLHSNIPFLAQEGMAIKWLHDYQKIGVNIIVNCKDAFSALQEIVCPIYLPNVYREEFYSPRDKEKEHIDIGCFGAIRPLKNQLIQAFAAIRFARERGKKLRFHINSTRLESGGESVMKNIMNLFADTKDTKIMLHPWMEPHEFVHYMHNHIDIGMQVSLSETFNVVTADYVTAGLPIVVSKEIKWVSRFSLAADNSVDDIVKTMKFAYGNNLLVRWNQHCLKVFSEDSLDMWAKAMSC